MFIQPVARKTTPIKPGLVSVVVTAFNQPEFLTLAVNSVALSDHPTWEVIVIDDGSTDGLTGGVCAALLSRADLRGRVRVVRVRNGGVSRARNWGLAHSDPAAPYVLFLDGDDELTPTGLSALVRALEAAPDAVASVGGARHVDAGGQPIFTDWRCPDFAPLGEAPQQGEGRRLFFPDVQADPGICPPATVLVRQWAARAVNGFDTTLCAVEDLDFYCRLALWGPLVGAGAVVALYRRHTKNLTLDAPLMARGFQGAEARREFLWRAWDSRIASGTPLYNGSL